AMIGPNLATMLAFVLTDAAVRSDQLASIAPRATDATFNCLSVEGHTSTNDTVLFLANGPGPALAGGDMAAFARAATAVCADLARAIAADAEGAAHLVTVEVEGLRDDTEARRGAQAGAGRGPVQSADLRGAA